MFYWEPDHVLMCKLRREEQALRAATQALKQPAPVDDSRSLAEVVSRKADEEADNG